MRMQAVSLRSGDVWWMPLLQGVIAVLLGAALLVRPVAIVSVFTVVVGIYLLCFGASMVAAGIMGRGAHSPWWQAGGGLLIAAAGAVAVINPLVGLLVPGALTFVLGLGTIAGGAMQLGHLRTGAGGRISWSALALGCLKIGLGVLVSLQPLVASLTLLRLLGAWALLGGLVLLVFAFRFRQVPGTS